MPDVSSLQHAGLSPALPLAPPGSAGGGTAASAMDQTLDKTAQTQHSCHEPQSSDADRALLQCKWTVSLCRRRTNCYRDICSTFWPDPGDTHLLRVGAVDCSDMPFDDRIGLGPRTICSRLNRRLLLAQIASHLCRGWPPSLPFSPYRIPLPTRS
jgi:hypothetical protein